MSRTPRSVLRRPADAEEADRSALWVGLAVLAVLTVVYPFVAPSAEHPLSVFVLAPMFTGILSGPRQTAIVGASAALVALVLGLLGPLSAVAVAVRLTILLASTVLAVVVSGARRHRADELSDARVRSALSESFQVGLMPSPRPPAWLDADTRYQPGGGGLLLGGDFVDVIALDDGAAAFVIGDVCGHGPRAAAFGTAVRAAWKGLAHAQPDDPVGWLDEVERSYFRDGRFDGFVTALAGRIQRDGRWRIASAGHPWPVRGGSATGVVELLPSLPLGTGLAGERHLVEGRLGPGESLLLYTDGLLENRHGPLGVVDDGVLAHVVAGHAGGLDLDRLLDQFGPEGFEDDVALLLLTCAPQVEGAARAMTTDTLP